MKVRIIILSARALLSFAAAGLLFYGLGASWAGIQPMGPLLSASTGIWKHRATTTREVQELLHKATTQAGFKEVRLEFDTNSVPRILAKSNEALYFAQGFLTAYYRLWQMDFLSRVALGRVAEIAGRRALPIDRFSRRLQLPKAVMGSTEVMVADIITAGPIASYTQGVNAWIGYTKSAPERYLPIEYRLFGVQGALPV